MLTPITAAPAAAAPAAAPGPWTLDAVAELLADPAAANDLIHVLHADGVPGWHLDLVGGVLWLLGYGRTR